MALNALFYTQLMKTKTSPEAPTEIRKETRSSPYQLLEQLCQCHVISDAREKLPSLDGQYRAPHLVSCKGSAFDYISEILSLQRVWAGRRHVDIQICTCVFDEITHLKSKREVEVG